MAQNIFNCPLPDENGYFGEYGGAFLPPELEPIMKEIAIEYNKIRKDPEFIDELYTFINTMLADLAQFFMQKIYLKSMV